MFLQTSSLPAFVGLCSLRVLLLASACWSHVLSWEREKNAGSFACASEGLSSRGGKSFFKTQPFTALIRNDNIKKKALCRERCASQNLEVCASCLLGLLLPPWAKHHPLLCFAFSFQLQEKARRAQKITRPPLSCVPPAPRSQSSPAALLLSSSCLL